MAEEKKSLFREKSIQSIQSPESLNEYLHVTSPGIWLLMGAIIVLLIGCICWGIFAHLDTTVQVAITQTTDGQTVCLVPEDALSAVLASPEVTVDGTVYELEPSVLEPVSITDSVDVHILLAGNLTSGDVVYPVAVNGSLGDSVLSGTIVTESITPISFLFNS